MNLKNKLLEIRDRATFIPVLCTEMSSLDPKEYYLLSRLGFCGDRCIQLTYIDSHKSSYDPYRWESNPRTLHAAHIYIRDNWDSIESGDVIDVEFISGETNKPKQSERISLVSKVKYNFEEE